MVSNQGYGAFSIVRTEIYSIHEEIRLTLKKVSIFSIPISVRPREVGPGGEFGNLRVALCVGTRALYRLHTNRSKATTTPSAPDDAVHQPLAVFPWIQFNCRIILIVT
jgi:hypothetical protein